MDWQRAVEEERAFLMRIVALILALADLAELACNRSSAACILICWILRPVEAVLSAQVTDDVAPAPIFRCGDVRDDARHLAFRFRALAHQLLCEAELLFSHPENMVDETRLFQPRFSGPLISNVFLAFGFVRPVTAPDIS